MARDPEDIFAKLNHSTADSHLKDGTSRAHVKHSRNWEWYLMALALLPSVVFAVLSVATASDDDEQSLEWTASMTRASNFIDGQRNYAELQGPDHEAAQHPAGSIYLSVCLHYLTAGGQEILARSIFSLLSMVTLTLVLLSYRYLEFGFVVHLLLGFSGNLFLIFQWERVNDCFAVFFLWLAIFSYQRGSWTTGCVAFAAALSVSSHMILALPAVVVVLLFSQGAAKATKLLAIIALPQAIISYPFTRTTSDMLSYLAGVCQPISWFRADFDQSRSFWCWLPKTWYDSIWFSTTLFGLYGAALVAFVAYPWMRPAARSLPSMIHDSGGITRMACDSKASQARTAHVSPGYIAETILSAVALPFLFAPSPSLPSYSYVYIAWTLPVMLHDAKNLKPFTPALLWLHHVFWDKFPRYAALGLAGYHVLPLVISLTKGYNTGTGEHKSPEGTDAMEEKRLLEPREKV